MADMRPPAAGGTLRSRRVLAPALALLTCVPAALGVSAAAAAARAAVGSPAPYAVASSAASEPAQCDALVLDPGGHVDVAQVTKAARKVQDQAADLRVRVYDSVPGGNLDAYVRGLTGRCPTWQDAAGGVKNNLVVLALDVGDRRTGLYYGDVYDQVLDRQWTGIQATAMNPQFREGHYTAGLVAGLGRVAHFVDPDHRPRHHHKNNQGNQGGQAPGPSGPTVSSSSSSGGGVVLLVLLAIAVVVAAAFGAATWRRRHAATTAARAEASAARGEMSDAFVALEEAVELTQVRIRGLPTVDDSGLRAARELAEQATTAGESATTEYLAVEEPNRDRAIAAMNTQSAAQAVDAMNQARDRLAAATTAWQAVEAKLDELDQLRADLPGRLATVDSLVTATRNLFAAREQDGFRTSELAKVTDSYAVEATAVRALLAQQRLGDADARAGALLAAVQATHDRVESLPALQQRLVTDVARLRSLASAAETSLAQARTVAAQLTSAYASECTADVDDAMTAAGDALVGIRAAADDAEHAADMSVQQFAEAEAAVSRGEGLTVKATAAVGVPAARRQELEALTAELRTRVDQLRTSCADLAATVSARPDAIAFCDPEPQTSDLAARLAQLADDVAASRPALYTARTALDEVGARLAGARERVDAVVTLFDKAAKRMKKATAAVADAESESRRTHAGQACEDLAADAAAALQDAEDAGDLDSRLERADEAIRLAVQAVEEARESRRRHQQNMGFGLGLGTGTAFGLRLGGSNNNAGGFPGGLSGTGGGGGDLGGGSSSFGGGGGGGDMGGGSSSW